MLVILFGTMGEFGNECIEYLKTKHKFEYVNKLIYDPELDRKIVDKKKNHVSYEEVDKCDFKYYNRKRYIGFNLSQFEDGIKGKKDILLTLSAHNIELIRALKQMYSNYVTVICAYVDAVILEEMTFARTDLTEEDKYERLEMAKEIKKLYIDYRSSFDELVVYAGEDSVLNKKSLFKQFDYIIKKGKEKEKKMNNLKYVDLPYDGNEPFVFISYNHKDFKKVKIILSMLQQLKCRVWYDDDIKKGEDWEKVLGSKIKQSAMLLIFTSKNSMKVDSYVYTELKTAKKLKKKMVAVRLDKTEFLADFYKELSKYQYIDYLNSNFDIEQMEKELLEVVDEKTILK